ncbi:MAG: hypothetical protein ACRYGG_11675 [Janthinobacterium lividum]
MRALTSDRQALLPLTMAEGFNFLPYRQIQSNRRRRRLFIECGGGALSGALMGCWLIARRMANERHLTAHRLALEDQVAALSIHPAAASSSDGASTSSLDLSLDRSATLVSAQDIRHLDEVLAILSTAVVPHVALTRVIVVDGSAQIEGVAVQFSDIARWQRTLADRRELRHVAITRSRRDVQGHRSVNGSVMPLPGTGAAVVPSRAAPLPTRIAFSAQLSFNGSLQTNATVDSSDPLSMSASASATIPFNAPGAGRDADNGAAVSSGGPR